MQDAIGALRRGQVWTEFRMTAFADTSKTSPLLANLAALWATEPLLADEIESIPESYAVEPSKSGEPTVAVETGDGRRIYVHSRYHPLDEARKLIDTVPTERRLVYYVLGLGMGYHLQTLFERSGHESIFCVFEPDADDPDSVGTSGPFRTHPKP